MSMGEQYTMLARFRQAQIKDHILKHHDYVKWVMRAAGFLSALASDLSSFVREREEMDVEMTLGRHYYHFLKGYDVLQDDPRTN